MMQIIMIKIRSNIVCQIYRYRFFIFPQKSRRICCVCFLSAKFSYSMLSSVLLSSWLIIFGLPLPLEAFMH